MAHLFFCHAPFSQLLGSAQRTRTARPALPERTAVANDVRAAIGQAGKFLKAGSCR